MTQTQVPLSRLTEFERFRKYRLDAESYSRRFLVMASTLGGVQKHGCCKLPEDLRFQ